MKNREELTTEGRLLEHITRLERDLNIIEKGNLATVREPEAKTLRHRIAVAKAELNKTDAPVEPIEDEVPPPGVANGLAEGTDINTVFLSDEEKAKVNTTYSDFEPGDYDYSSDADWADFWETDGGNIAVDPDSSDNS